MALQRLKEAARRPSASSRTTMETTVNLPFITADQSGPKHLQMTITRSKFEQLIDPLSERLRGPVPQAIKDAKLDADKIDEVVLVGGSTRIPVQEMVKEIFGKEPNKSVNPDEVVAVGAAIQGGVLAGRQGRHPAARRDPADAGRRDAGRRDDPLIEKNTTIPTSKKETFSTAADNQTEVTIHVLQGEREMAATTARWASST
jgi:molecular chaperone DnaK